MFKHSGINGIEYQGIMDTGSIVPDIEHMWFLGVGGAVTCTGFFVDIYGHKVGASFTQSIPVGNGTNDPVRLNAGTIPAGAVGAYVRFSADVYWDSYYVSPAAFSTDFETNYARYPKLATDPEYTAVGRCS